MAPTRDSAGDSCKTNPQNEPITIFTKESLEYCGFMAELLPPSDADVTIWVQNETWENISTLLEPPKENVTIDGEPAVMYRYSHQQARPNVNAARIYFNHGGKGYLIFLKNQDLQGDYYDPLYDQILSTFRFVNSE